MKRNLAIDSASERNHPHHSADVDTHLERPDILIENETLPEHALRNVETIYHHQAQHQINSKPHHRIIDKIGDFFGKPQFLYGQVIFFIVWIGCSNLAENKIIPKNFPLFDLHFHGLEVASLLTTTGVLVYQRREEQVSQQRSHLALQVNLVTEQKIAKLISLVEELRVDLPNVKNRQDAEAEIMKQATDPQAILDVIQQISDQPPATHHEDK
jgi:uncharacterized membrane protein